jgi:hypothetical protein
MGRKREKGKVRKAKAAAVQAATQQSSPFNAGASAQVALVHSSSIYLVLCESPDWGENSHGVVFKISLV